MTLAENIKTSRPAHVFSGLGTRTCGDIQLHDLGFVDRPLVSGVVE